jgi:hypothetical protein
MSCKSCEDMPTSQIHNITRNVVVYMVEGHKNVVEYLRVLEAREKDPAVLARIRGDITTHEKIVEMLKRTEVMRRGEVNERDQNLHQGEGQGPREV